MEKIKLEYKVPKNVSFEWNGNNIEVQPYLDLPQQSVLIKKYLMEYFNEGYAMREPEDVILSDSKYCYLEAEYSLMNLLLHLVTNIEVQENDFDLNVYDSSDLYNQVISRIKNYDSFKERLNRIILDIKEEEAQQKSIGTVLDSIADRLYLVLDNFSNITPENIANLAQLTGDLTGKINDVQEEAPELKKDKKKSKK